MQKKRQIRKLIYLQNIEIFKNMKLHYSQANNATISRMIKFYYHMKLHYSQTYLPEDEKHRAVYYHMKLHYSQTL